MPTSLQFALSNPTPGMEEEFNHWYGGDHLTHGVQVPGVLSGQRFRRVVGGPLPSGIHDYLMLWEFDDPRLALEELAKVKGGADMPISPAIDMSTVQPPTMWLRASVRNGARVVTDTASRKTVVLVLLNPFSADADAVFQSQMLHGELARIADLAGVISADFLTLADEQIRGNARKFRYGLLIELADEAVALPSVTRSLQDLPHVDRSKWIAATFRPIGQRLTAAEVRRVSEHV